MLRLGARKVMIMKNTNVYNTAVFTDSDFKIARDSWVTDLCGNEISNSLSVAGMSELLRMRQEDSDSLRLEMNRSADAPILFGDKRPTASGELKLQYDRVLRMALPYGTVGCKEYRSDKLLSDVVYALDWLYDNMYGENVLTDSSFRSWKEFDWWDWYVGAACPLMDVLMIIEDAIGICAIRKYVTPVEFLATQMRTAPNAAEAMSRIVTLTPLSLINNDRELLGRLFDECEMLLEEHDSGDNMRRDYCCMTHGMPYNVAYGVINLSRIGKVVKILSGTPLAYPLRNKDNLKKMLRFCFAPVMYRGRTLAPMNGRAMQYDNSAASILRDVHYLFGVFDADFDLEISELIHRHGTPEVAEQLISSYASGMTLEKYRKINVIPGTRMAEAPKTHIHSYAMYCNALNGTSLFPHQTDMAYMWYSGDICVQHRHGCMIGLRMPSSRSYGYECMNGDNGDGWYTGDGALYLYTPESDNDYSPEWWSCADKHLIPGTTVDDRQREIMFFNKAWKSDRDFVGGVCLDESFLTATMDYEAFHNEVDEGRADNGYGRSLPVHKSTLTAQKSWFFFDRAILALGTRINAEDGYGVLTVVENRMLDEKEFITVDGMKVDNIDGDITFNDPERLYVPSAGGYIFPKGGRIVVKHYTRKNHRFVSVYICHGIDPHMKDYAYIILPNYSADEVFNYDINDIEILSNNGKIQAAKEHSSGLCGIVFIEGGKLETVSSEQPLALMLRRDTDERIVSLSASDPTQKLDSFELVLDECTDIKSSYDGFKVISDVSAIRLYAVCDSAKGRAFCAKI